jgi:hypothetical protein
VYISYSTNRRDSRTANHSDSSSSLGLDNLLSLSIFSSECRNQRPTPTQTNPLSLFFTAPTQAMGPGNFTDYRIHTTTTLTTTTSAMASKQPNLGAVGFNDRRLEQDKTMGGPMAGAEQPAPELLAPEPGAAGPPAPPPLRIDTAYQFRAGSGPPLTGAGGGPWTGAQFPTAAPQKGSRKNHVAKPDSFKDRRDFNKFSRSAYLYTVANPGEFPDDKSKVLFYLSYMKEGLLGQFAENVVQQMMDYEVRGLKVDMEFKDFMEGMTNTFGDVNKGAAVKKLSTEDVGGGILPSI